MVLFQNSGLPKARSVHDVLITAIWPGPGLTPVRSRSSRGHALARRLVADVENDGLAHHDTIERKYR